MSEEQVISGEEHRARQAAARKGTQVVVQTRYLGLVVAFIVLCGLSFWSGMAYQQHHDAAVTVRGGAAASNSATRSGGRGGFGRSRRAGGFGQVTAISAASITITNQRTNASQSFTIASTTNITDNGQTVTTSDIQTGDTVLIMTAGSGSTAAVRIVVNPSFGGLGGAGAPASPSGTVPNSN